MNALSEIKNRFKPVLDSLVDDSAELLAMIRPSRDGGFGDYQVNCAMPLKDRLGKAPRDIASDLIGQIKIDDLCQNVEVAGPGFINLTLDDDWLCQRLINSFSDERLGIQPVTDVKTVVVDFSSPNVAKPMHAGHIRSTVIGDALQRILKFVGQKVITVNHLGDWGTQFGMIIYGFKNFVDLDAYEKKPIDELARLYKLVRKLMDFHSATKQLPAAEELLQRQHEALEKVSACESTGDKKADKKNKRDRSSLNEKISDQSKAIACLQETMSAIADDDDLSKMASEHADINAAVLNETAALHRGDKENCDLWNQFLPICRADIQRIYDRLSVKFDHELGESFYHERLPDVVESFKSLGIARESEGALCVFLDEFDSPMIIQKKDGAFLYSTSDLATVKYRLKEWQADVVLYVVDHRQHEHFGKLFAAAAKWGFDSADLNHISFGTVLGQDGKPYKTRSGDTVGLEGLLDEAESRALKIAEEQNAIAVGKDPTAKLSDDELRAISKVVGIGSLKYADLSQNRMSDYKFSYDKMLALKGNTATYLQYSYARVQGILRRGDVDIESFRNEKPTFNLSEDVERKLALQLSRFGEALDEVLMEYKPNLLASYLFDLTQTFFQFYDQCHVLKAKDESIRASRLRLCDLTARTIKTGLGLLGIGTVDQM